MATVAQAAAAMLALFFAAVSVVASTAYAKVTSEIRALIFMDDLNRRYLRLLAHTAATATTGIGVHAIGVPASSLFAGYVALLAGVCLLAFLPLGIRTFSLLDPSKLTGYPTRLFVRAVEIATFRGRHWLDPSFQNHANRIAEAQLQLLDDLMGFGLTENRPRHNTVLDIAKASHRLTRVYCLQKSAIPSESLWFTRKAKFKRWDLTSSSSTEVAIRTGTVPPPEPVPDHAFVETRCIDMTIRCLKHLFGRDALDDAVSVLLEVNATATAQARHFEHEDSLRLVRAVRTVVVDKLRATDPSVEPLKHLQLIDVFCVAALAPILTVGLALSEQPMDSLHSIVTSLLALRHRRLHTSVVPRVVLLDAEDLLQRLNFEQSVEGHIRTRAWYVRQVIALGYANVVREVIRTIAATVNSEFVDGAEDLISEKRALWAGV